MNLADLVCERGRLSLGRVSWWILLAAGLVGWFMRLPGSETLMVAMAGGVLAYNFGKKTKLTQGRIRDGTEDQPR